MDSRAKVFVAALFLFLLSPNDAGAQASAQNVSCGQSSFRTVTYKFCVEKGEGVRANDVLFFLHGLGQDERTWLNHSAPKEIRETWKRMGVKRPSVVSVSFGAAWLLTHVNRNGVAPLMDIFVKEVMPKLEAKVTKKVNKRYLAGASMGGFNATQLLLSQANLFARIALVCPAIPPVGPYSSQDEIDAFFERNRPHVHRDVVLALLEWSRQEFPSVQDWQRHDPLYMIPTLGRLTPPIYVAVSDIDQFGIYEGVAEFAKRAYQQSVSVQWMPMKGLGHCDLSTDVVQGLANFFSDRSLLELAVARATHIELAQAQQVQ